MSDELTRIDEELAALKARRVALLKEAARRPVEDYVFLGADGEPVRLSELFGDKRDLLVIHNMGRSCVYCTLWADGMVGLAPHLMDRCALALSSPDDAQTLCCFARSRGWRFPVVSTRETAFARDMGFEHEGDPMPGVSAFRRNPGGVIVRTGKDRFGPGDDYCALWPLLELLEHGAEGWAPKYDYPRIRKPAPDRAAPAAPSR